MNDRELEEVIDAENLTMFFKFKDSIYGLPEMSRVVFAKLKDPNDEDNNKVWRKEANFSAINLQKEQDNQTILNADDVKDIKIISKEEALKAMKK